MERAFAGKILGKSEKTAEKLEGLIRAFASAQKLNVWERSVRILIFQYRKQLNGSIL